MTDANRPKRGRSWRDDQGGKTDLPQGTTSRGRQIVVLAALLFTLVGALIAFLLMVGGTPDVLFVPVCFDEYSGYQLRNPWASRDRALLKTGLEWKREPLKTETDLNAALAQARLTQLPDVAGDAPLVVYINALARLTEGKVSILTPDAKPDQPNSGVLLDDVISALDRCSTNKKFLILDLQRPLRHARLGLLGEDIGSAIRQTLERLAPKNLHVLTSAAPLQDSAVSDEMGQSVFAYYLHAGLRGGAAAFDPEAKTPDRVTVRGLARFVHARVKRWARENRNQDQTPLYWRGEGAESFELSSPSRAALAGTPPPPPATTSAASPSATGPDAKPPEDPPEVKAEKQARKALQDVWVELDAWREHGVGRAAGAQLQFWHARALEIEDRWRTGADRTLTARELEERLTQIRSNREEISKSLYQARSPSVAAALVRLRFLKGAAAAEKPARLDDAVRDFALGNADARKTIDDLFKEKPDDRPLLVTKAVLDAAADLKGLNKKRLEALLQLLPRDGGQDPNTLAEIALLREWVEGAQAAMLDDVRLVLDVVQPTIQLMRTGEEMLAADPRLWPWLGGLVQQAEDRRQVAFQLLSHPDCLPIADLTQQIEQAKGTVAAVVAVQRSLSEALRSRDRVMADLPSLAEMIAARPFTALQFAQVEQQVKDWLAMADRVQELDRALQPPAAGQAPLDVDAANRTLAAPLDLARRLEASRKSLYDALIDNIGSRLKAIHDNREGSPADYGEISALLLWTWLPAKERDLLLEARQKLGTRLWQATLAKDKVEDEANRKAPPVEADPPGMTAPADDVVRFNDSQALVHARLAVGLLRLAGLGADALQKFNFDAPPSSIPSEWGLPFAQCWRQQLRTLLEAQRTTPSLNGDRLTRVYFQGRLAPWEEFTASRDNQLTLRLVQGELRSRDQWLAQHFLELESAWRGREPWSTYFGQLAPATLVTRDAGSSAARFDLSLSEPIDLQSPGDDAPPTATTPLVIAYSGSDLRAQDVRVQALFDQRWMQVRPPNEWQADGPGKLRGDLIIDGKAELPQQGDKEPGGFWLLVRCRDRLHAKRVRVSNLAGKLREPRLRLAASADGENELEAQQGLELRTSPRLGQGLFVFVNNPGKTERTLRVRLLGADNRPLRTTEEFKLPVGPEFRAPAALKKLYDAWPAEKPPLINRDLTFELLDEATGRVIARRELRLVAVAAGNLLRLERPMFQNGELSLDLVPRRNFPESAPLAVELRIQPEVDLPLERQPRPIVRTESVVGATRRTIKVKVEGRRRAGRGEVVIGVDGDARAYVVHFWPEDSRAEVVTTRELRIVGDSYAQPGQVKEYVIAASNLGEGDFQWDLRSFGGDEAAAKPMRPARLTRFSLTGGGPDAGLVLSAAVEDFRQFLKVPDDGRPQALLQVVLADRRGRLEATKEVIIAEPLRLRANQVRAHLKGDKVELQLDMPARRVPLKSVKFMRADTKAEIKEQPTDLGADDYRVWLPLPPKGANLSVNIDVEDLAGQKEQLLDVPIDVERLRAEMARAELGAIRATILRAGQRQGAGYRVVVSQQNAQGQWITIKEEVTTGDSVATLEPLPAGAYWVSCQANDGKKDGKAVTVEKRKTVEVTLELK